MISSTASAKSLRLALALHALVGPAPAAGAAAAVASDPVVGLLRPLLLVDRPSSSRTSSSSPPSPRRNASAHSATEEEAEPELPAELAALVAAARATPAAATRTKVGDGGGTARYYYAAHGDDGARCAPKPAAAFEAWEEAHATRAACCAAAFGWDYRACAEGDATEDAAPSSASAAEDEAEGWELPEELAALIAAAQATPDPAPATPPGEGAGARYYAAHEEGAPCASKPAAEFEGWEASHATLGECCEAAFGWDYDACVEPSR